MNKSFVDFGYKNTGYDNELEKFFKHSQEMNDMLLKIQQEFFKRMRGMSDEEIEEENLQKLYPNYPVGKKEYLKKLLDLYNKNLSLR